MLYRLGLSDGPFVVDGVHDPDNIRPMRVRLKPDVWQADTVYGRTSKDSYDVVVPQVFMGLYYKVVNPGRSHETTEPPFARVVGEITEDFRTGFDTGLTWEAAAFDLMSLDEDITDVVHTLSNGVTLSAESNTTSVFDFTIAAIAADAAARTAKTFQIQSRITTTVKRFDVRFEFNLGEW